MNASPDPVIRALLALIALALLWVALRGPVQPPRADATSRETVNVNLERIGGHLLFQGAIPVRCADWKP